MANEEAPAPTQKKKKKNNKKKKNGANATLQINSNQFGQMTDGSLMGGDPNDMPHGGPPAGFDYSMFQQVSSDIMMNLAEQPANYTGDHSLIAEKLV